MLAELANIGILLKTRNKELAEIIDFLLEWSKKHFKLVIKSKKDFE